MFNVYFKILMICLLFVYQDVKAEPQLVSEPALNTQVSWEVLPNGMMIIGYDLDHNNVPDYFTERVVLRSFFSRNTHEQEGANFPRNIVYKVDYTSGSYFYIIEKRPIFYAMDVDEDGIWDLIYKDPYADGVNGNETFYESPSGLFLNCPGQC